MKRSAALLALLAVLAAPAQAPAQGADVRIESPGVRPGDTWIYNKLDGRTGEIQDVAVASVQSLGPEGIVMRASGVDGSGATKVLRTASFNLVRIEAPAFTQTADPYYPNFSFPLHVGRTWSGKVVLNNSRQGDTDVTAELAGRATGWEMVTVPAGNFLALKLVMKGSFVSRGLLGTVSGEIEDTLWYAPEVRNAVRYEYRDSVGGSAYNHEVHELVRYWPGP